VKAPVAQDLDQVEEAVGAAHVAAGWPAAAIASTGGQAE
jgi:hypothetical protein